LINSDCVSFTNSMALKFWRNVPMGDRTDIPNGLHKTGNMEIFLQVSCVHYVSSLKFGFQTRMQLDAEQ
jgi:hypothetical protein